MMLDVKSFQLQSFLPLPYEEVLPPTVNLHYEQSLNLHFSIVFHAILWYA